MCIAHKAKVMVKTKRHVIKSYHVRGWYSLSSVRPFLGFNHSISLVENKRLLLLPFFKLTRVVYIQRCSFGDLVTIIFELACLSFNNNASPSF